MPTRTMQRGFSLVELMVGVVITLLATVIMFQIFALAERNKRTTTGASNAQTNGALALFILERETRMAGFSLTGSALNDCDPKTTYTYYSDGKKQIDLDGLMQPVRIVDGSHKDASHDGVSDRIRLAMPGSDQPANFSVGRTNLRDSMTLPQDELKVESVYGCAAGSLILMVQPCAVGGTAAGNCALMEVTGASDSALTIQHVAKDGSATWNPTADYQTKNGWPLFARNESCKAYGVCLPKPEMPGFTEFAISYDDGGGISTRQLTSRRVDSAGKPIDGDTPASLAPEIMDLQAQYGLSATPSGALTWQEPTAGWAATAALSQAQIKQIKAIRIAIVARSGEYEKPRSADGSCDATTVAPAFSWDSFVTTDWPADWKCYRYKVFETVIPLINVIWANV